MDTGIQNLYDAANIFEFHCTGEQDDVNLCDYINQLVSGGFTSFSLKILGEFHISTTPNYTISNVQTYCQIGVDNSDYYNSQIELDWTCAEVKIPESANISNNAFLGIVGTSSITIKGLHLNDSSSSFKYCILNNSYRLENIFGGVCKLTDCKIISANETTDAYIIYSSHSRSHTELISCELYAIDTRYIIKSENSIHLINCKLLCQSYSLIDRTVIYGNKVTLTDCNFTYIAQYSGNMEWNSSVKLISANYKLNVYGGEYTVSGKFKIGGSAGLNLFSMNDGYSSIIKLHLNVFNTQIYLNCQNDTISGNKLLLNCISLVGSSTYENIADLQVIGNTIISDLTTKGFGVYGKYVQPTIGGNIISYAPEVKDKTAGCIYLSYSDGTVVNNNLRVEETQGVATSPYAIVVEGSDSTKFLALGNTFRGMKTNIRNNTTDLDNNLYI